MIYINYLKRQREIKTATGRLAFAIFIIFSIIALFL